MQQFHAFFTAVSVEIEVMSPPAARHASMRRFPEHFEFFVKLLQ